MASTSTSTTWSTAVEGNSSANWTATCTFDVALFLRYAGTLVVILGLVGNFLSILVFSRKSLRSRSCSIYFLALSVSDVHVLLGYSVENLLFHGYDIQLLSNSLMCKVIVFLIYASTDISNYLLTLAAIDRCVLISNCKARPRFCRKSTAKLLIAIVVILFSLVNSHILVGFRLDDAGSCLPVKTGYKYFYIHHYDSYIDIIKTVLVPFVVIFVCNTFIIFKYTRRKHSFVNNASSKRKSRRRREKDRQLTWFLFSSSILFVLLTLPSEINDFVLSYLSPHYHWKHACQLWTMTTIFILVHQINHASHFYVYTLTGPIFRKEFQKIICLFQRRTTRKRSLVYSKRESLTMIDLPPDDVNQQRISVHIDVPSDSSAHVSFDCKV